MVSKEKRDNPWEDHCWANQMISDRIFDAIIASMEWYDMRKYDFPAFEGLRFLFAVEIFFNHCTFLKQSGGG